MNFKNGTDFFENILSLALCDPAPNRIQQEVGMERENNRGAVLGTAVGRPMKIRRIIEETVTTTTTTTTNTKYANEEIRRLLLEAHF